MDGTKPLPGGSVGAAALEALAKAKAEEEAKNVMAGKDITSLNKMLQWSTANSADPSSGVEDGSSNAEKSKEELEKDKEWLDAAFPDMFADVKKLIEILETKDVDDDTRVEVLLGLEEYFVDLNYAVNIEKLGALEPVLQCTTSENAEVRTSAVWVLGSALQDLQEVKDVFMKRDGHIVLARCLKDENAKVRAKAVMASSALMRNSPPEIQEKFRAVGGDVTLRRLLSDDNIQVRRRARFFLQHAPVTGNEIFVRDLLCDRNAIALLSDSISAIDVSDIADVDAAVGAVKMLVETDRQGLLQVAPELPGVVDDLIKNCDDPDLSDSLKELASMLD